jgi:hypothetical protein
VYATSDGADGLRRPNDFNTMTIMVSDDDNRILGIESNMRKIVPSNTKTVPVSSYEIALQKLKNNQYSYIFTSPSGNGQVAWNKVYPNNKAVSDKATIQEAEYVYLESLPNETQTQLKPYVLFRGTSVLNSGYRVTFIAAVDATSNTTAMNKQVLGTSSSLLAEGDSQVIIGITPITPFPTDGTGPVRQCQPQVSELRPTIVATDSAGTTLKLGLGPYIRMVQHSDGSYAVETRNEQRWYWIPPDGYNSKSMTDKQADLQKAFNAFTEVIASIEPTAMHLSGNEATLYCPDKNNPGHTDKSCKRTWELLFGDFTRYQGYYNQGCPLIFSGLSPVIFVYGPEGQIVDIKSFASLTYADPATNDSSWHVVVGKNNALTVNNTSRNYIYYEYTKQSFTRPQQGWNISKDELTQFVNKIANSMKLTSLEAQRLQTELQNAAADINSNNLFIGILDKDEVNTKIPLYVYPLPPVFERIHFYVGKNKGIVNAPNLSPIQRKPFMVLEFGAVPEQ